MCTQSKGNVFAFSKHGKPFLLKGNFIIPLFWNEKLSLATHLYYALGPHCLLVYNLGLWPQVTDNHYVTTDLASGYTQLLSITGLSHKLMTCGRGRSCLCLGSWLGTLIFGWLIGSVWQVFFLVPLSWFWVSVVFCVLAFKLHFVKVDLTKVSVFWINV